MIMSQQGPQAVLGLSHQRHPGPCTSHRSLLQREARDNFFHFVSKTPLRYGDNTFRKITFNFNLFFKKYLGSPDSNLIGNRNYLVFTKDSSLFKFLFFETWRPSSRTLNRNSTASGLSVSVKESHYEAKLTCTQSGQALPEPGREATRGMPRANPPHLR